MKELVIYIRNVLLCEEMKENSEIKKKQQKARFYTPRLDVSAARCGPQEVLHHAMCTVLGGSAVAACLISEHWLLVLLIDAPCLAYPQSS